MLFSYCVNVILGSIELVRKAVCVLPKNISCYILFEACLAHKHAAVAAIVESWPHSEITFDFMSNGYCRRQRHLQNECIDICDYYNTSYLDDIIISFPSVVLGLFNNIYTSQLNGQHTMLRKVDLSRIKLFEHSNGKCKRINSVPLSTNYVVCNK